MIKIGLVLLLVATTLVACTASDTQMERYAEKFVSPPITVAAKQLFIEYARDPEQAALQYAGHRLIISGTVHEIRDDNDFEPIIEFDVCEPDSFCFEGLVAQFSERRRQVVTAWQRGQEVTLLCYIPVDEGLGGFSVDSVVALRMCQPYN